MIPHRNSIFLKKVENPTKVGKTASLRGALFFFHEIFVEKET